jgi:thymidylate synthase (FAD)
MLVINASAEIINIASDPLKIIEVAGRTCYKSDSGDASKFVSSHLNHESILEHSSVTVRFICDRGVSHEIVRHRLASYSQESTRYCNYSKNKFSNQITVIKPCFWSSDSSEYSYWAYAVEAAEKMYLLLLEKGATPQEARSVLPNSLKTELVMTANFREWRYFFQLRALGLKGKPHPQMLEVTVPLLKQFQSTIPEVFTL